MPKYKVKANDKAYEVVVTDTMGGGASVEVEGKTFEVEPTGVPVATAPIVASTAPMAAPPPAAPRPAAPVAGGSGAIVAPIPGVVTKVLVKTGDSVEAGQIVLRLEAMKMENDISSPVSGTVKEVAVSDGSEVSDGQLLVVVE